MWQDENSGTVKYLRGTYISNPATLNEISSKESLSINPNPAINYIIIENTFGESVLLVHDLLGKEILSQQITNSQNSITLDITTWNKGMYIVQIESKDKNLTRKIIKE